MRLATITNWAYGATLVLTLASGTTMLLASRSQEQERAAVAQRFDLDGATSSLDEDVFVLSGLARRFAVSGNTADLIAYKREADALRTVETRTLHLRDAGGTREELASLQDSMRAADDLRNQQQQAIAARQAGKPAEALAIIFSAEYERELDRIAANVRQFQYRLDQRTLSTVLTATQVSRIWRTSSEVALAITALLFLCVLYFIFRNRVLRPVVKLSDVVGRLAAQDFAAEPPAHDHVDEIGDMAQALRIFRENGLERQRLERERDADRAMRDLLSRMTQRLQSCDSVADLKRVVGCFMPEVATGLAGRLYLLEPERNAVVEACSWLFPVHSRAEFPPLSCWALRRGAIHSPSDGRIDVPCEHLGVAGPTNPGTICLPLVGQRGTLGLLYLERREGAPSGEILNIYISMVAENLGLALDNLRLREAMKVLAMTDPLTLIPNRRRLDQELEEHVARAEIAGSPLCCAMIDIDHFKRFNDEHGHAAGDAVLRAIAATLRQSIRGDDVVFRYGGEEFLVLLPGCELAIAQARAEQMRAAIAGTVIQHEGKLLGPITASIGLACAPSGCSYKDLVETADAVLYRAKRKGRDRVESDVQRIERRDAA